MFKLLALLTIMYSSLIQASFSLPLIEWQKLSEEKQASVWIEYRHAFRELQSSEVDEVTEFNSRFFSEAYAAGFDCFVAGWPSQKINGRCSSPEKKNPHYTHHVGCQQGEILCHPALFGEGLCADFKTQTQKNTAFSQCEKKFSVSGRLYSDVLSEVDPDEMNDLIATVHHKCAAHSSNYTCQKLRKNLDFIVVNETPANFKLAKDKLTSSSPEQILHAAQALQKELERDILSYEKNCAQGISEEKGRLCKNIALRVKKSEALVPQLMNRINQMDHTSDCINCSSHKKSTVLQLSAIPSLEAVEKLQCSETEKKKISDQCFKDVQCVILSTAASAPLAIMEAFGKKSNTCLSSQNDCLSNVVSAMIDSLLSLVTGLWDLLGTAVEWTGEKLANFWSYLTQIEDKTSDAQHMLNKMSAKEVEEVKQNPLEWISSLAGNIWKGLGEWMKEDIFCEKWAGIPRASQCLEPSRGFDCMSCKTMLTGTCSIAGVVIAEVFPALITGGSANLVARAGSGAKAFSKFVKTSKSYKKIVSTVDKLSDVKALKIVTGVTKSSSKAVVAATKPLSKMSKISLEAISSSYKAMIKTKSYKALSKSMDVAAKYTGIKAFNKLNSHMYAKGHEFVDNVLGVKVTSHAAPKMIHRMDEASELVRNGTEELAPVFADLQAAEKLRIKYKKLVEEGVAIRKIKDFTPEVSARNSARAAEMKDLEGDILLVNRKFVENISTVFEKHKIPFTLGRDTHHAQMIVIDFSQPTSNYAVEMYKKVKDRFGLDRITLSLNENTLLSSRGFFMGNGRLDMGPEQAMDLLQEHFNAVSKHESRHGMFYAKRAKGKESIFHSRFKESAEGNLLNDKKYYDEFMSSEELYTFSTDIQTLAQGFKGEYLTNPIKKNELIKTILQKNENLKTVASTSKTMSKEMLDSVDEILRSSHPSHKLDINFRRGEKIWDVSFKDKLGREVDLVFVSEAEKKMVQVAHDARLSLKTSTDEFVNHKMAEAGVNLRGLENSRQYGVVSAEHQKMIEDFTTEFMITPGARTQLKVLDEASREVIEKSRHKLDQLNRLSDIQIRQTENLSRELKLYHTSQSESQFRIARDQMFKMAKNVKEDYSGFALNARD